MTLKGKLVNIYNKLTDQNKIFKYMSVKEFCQLKGYRHQLLAKAAECEELRPQIWKIRDEAQRCIRTLPETYVAEIKDAVVLGENDFIISDDMVLSDMFTSEYADRMTFIKRAVKSIDLKKHEVTLSYHNFRHLPIEKAFWMVGIFAGSYYHFLIDLLPKLYYLYQCEDYDDYPILADSCAYQNFKSIIDIYNIKNRKILCVNQDVAYKVKRLIVSSNCAWYDKYVLENYFQDIGHVYDKAALKFVREQAISKVQSEGKPLRVYASRRQMSQERRRLVHDDVIEVLFQKHGFVLVCPEELTFLEQVQLFSQTKVFAGVTGAAFTNMIFLPEDATVIYSTCVCGNTGENLFPSLWNAVGKGEFITLQGNVTAETENLKDNLRMFELNIQEIEELLSTL